MKLIVAIGLMFMSENILAATKIFVAVSAAIELSLGSGKKHLTGLPTGLILHALIAIFKTVD